MSDNREKILLCSGILMEKRGYCGTGLNEIIQNSGAPKGSLYYYFPDGKEQIASEVAIRAGEIIAQRIRDMSKIYSEPSEVIFEFLKQIAKKMEENDFHSGSTITMMAMESVTQSKRINQACQEAYLTIINALKELLMDGGVEAERAQGMAEIIISAIEGGIILSRTFQSPDYIRRVADRIKQMLNSTPNNQP
ncbi:MAG TPA: TetR/AcrR family transcriptional regulator [Anaerolineales bacterium]|nr:TetR/AcrR family transcriptional regulator [Anaerolineales bacterium]